MSKKCRVVIGISGASGGVYALKLLEILRYKGYEVHLIITKAGVMMLRSECSVSREDVHRMADFVYPIDAIWEVLASGSFFFDAMIVVPCSTKTLAAIASGVSDNLLLRVADVAIKEKRRLVLLLRETPLSHIHLKNALTLANAGVFIAPPVPAFYLNPSNIDELVYDTVAMLLRLIGIEIECNRVWRGLPKEI